MSNPTKTIFELMSGIRCDEPMRRSKENCFTPFNKKWRCDYDCYNCICGLKKKEDGTWEHIKPKEVKNYVESSISRGNE